MRLRRRVALTFALSTSCILVASRIMGIVSFDRVQERQLDMNLIDRAHLELDEVRLLGPRAITRPQEPTPGFTSTRSRTATFSALYNLQGELIVASQNFESLPNLSVLLNTSELPKHLGIPFDFPFRDNKMRGTLTRVPSIEGNEAYLLVAASRHEMDEDYELLLHLSILTLSVTTTIAALLGGWLGRRMTRGVEAVAEAARRVTEGNLDVFIPPNTSHDWEVKALVQAISEMLTRIRKHIALERQFAAYAAHELRSPLAALKGELELALRRPRSKEEYEKALRSALEDTNRLVALSEDLLVYARSAGDTGMTAGTDVSLSEVIHDSLKTSLGRVQAKVPFAVECPDVRVKGNPRDLARALRNLLDNAIVHAPSGSFVSIHCTRASESSSPTLNIDISDWGDGVPEDLVDDIFQPFVRAPRERGRSGAGLGLAIARQIARRNGGDLLLVSASNPTCFRLTLSLAASESFAEAVPLSSAVAIDRSGTPTLATRHTQLLSMSAPSAPTRM